MSEKGMTFRGDEVPLVLSGQTTMTRRLVSRKRLPGWNGTDPVYEDRNGDLHDLAEYSPYQPGDIIYIRETWAVHSEEFEGIGRPHWLQRDSDGKTEELWMDGTVRGTGSAPAEYCPWPSNSVNKGWRSPVTMPKWATRPWRGEIIQVRAERDRNDYVWVYEWRAKS